VREVVSVGLYLEIQDMGRFRVYTFVVNVPLLLLKLMYLFNVTCLSHVRTKPLQYKSVVFLPPTWPHCIFLTVLTTRKYTCHIVIAIRPSFVLYMERGF
jgi:hypothetical protein